MPLVGWVAGCSARKGQFIVEKPCIDSSGHFQVVVTNKTGVAFEPDGVSLMLLDDDGPPEDILLYADGKRQFGWSWGYDETIKLSEIPSNGAATVAETLRRPSVHEGLVRVRVSKQTLGSYNLAPFQGAPSDNSNHVLELYRSHTFPIKRDLKVALPEGPLVDNSPRQNAAALDVIDVWNAYQRNTLSADQRFLREKFRFTGFVFTVKEAKGKPVLFLRIDPDKLPGVVCFFPESTAPEAAGLQPGHRVTIEGTGAGSESNVPLFGNCRVVDYDGQ